MPEDKGSRRSNWFETWPAENYSRIFGQLLLFICWLAITFTACILRPAADGHGTHQELGFPPCPSVLLFDRPCPGCGLTTSWTRLLHGDFIGAFKAHAIGPLFYLMFTVSAFIAFYSFCRREKLYIHTFKTQVVIVAFAVIFFAYGISRFVTVGHYQTAKEHSLAMFLYPHS